MQFYWHVYMLCVGPKSLRVIIILCSVSDNDTSICYKNVLVKSHFPKDFIWQLHTHKTFHRNQKTDLIVYHRICQMCQVLQYYCFVRQRATTAEVATATLRQGVCESNMETCHLHGGGRPTSFKQWLKMITTANDSWVLFKYMTFLHSLRPAQVAK